MSAGPSRVPGVGIIAHRLTTAQQRSALLEARAKDAYDIWANCAPGCHEPWERLSAREMDAWREVVKAAADAPYCAECGDDMACPACDIREFISCPDCGDDLTCAACEAVRTVR